MAAKSELLPDTDTYYMRVALAVRAKANCRGRRVGAVLVLQNRIISTGYNGVPEGMANCLQGGCLRCKNPENRYPTGTAYDLCICVHAEENALLTAARFGIAVDGATMYSTIQPCFSCAKALLQAEVRRVIYLDVWAPHDPKPRMETLKKAEYEKLFARLDGKHFPISDPQAKWAKGVRVNTK